MGIDCGSEEGPSSPVFHKKKWVVLPTSLKRSGSESLLTKCPEKKLKNKRNDDSDIRFVLYHDKIIFLINISELIHDCV